MKTIMGSHLTNAAKLSSDWGPPLTIRANRGEALTVTIFEEWRRTGIRDPGDGLVPPFQFIEDFTSAMEAACDAEVPRLRALLVDFWEDAGGIARLPRCAP